MSSPRASWVTSRYPALASTSFVIYLLGNIVSLTGMWMQSLAQGWLVLRLTDSPFMLGLVGAFWAVPTIIFSLFAGVVADRVDRRKLLMITRSINMICSFSLAALIIFGQIQVWHVFAFAAVMGTNTAFDMPASQALVPSLVQPRHLMNAIALISAAFNGTRIIGPSIAGFLVAQFDVQGCYIIAGTSTIFMLVALLFIPSPPIATRKTGTVLGHIGEGISYVRRDDLRVTLLWMMVVSTLFGMAYPTMMPVFARNVYDEGAQGYGILMAFSGVGSFVGTLFVASVGNVRHSGIVALVCSLFFGLFLVGFGLTTTLTFGVIMIILVGLANSVYSTMLNTMIQRNLDEEYRGRTMSVVSLVQNSMPLAGLQAGAIASVLSPAIALIANGLVVVGASVFFGLKASRLREE